MPARSLYKSLQDTHIIASAGITRDSYDNALAKTVNGLYKTEVIHHQKPQKRMIDVELTTLKWVDWFNHRLSAMFHL